MGRRILVAYDGSLLSRRALEEAKRQAKQYTQSEVHIISVMRPSGPAMNVNIARSIGQDLIEKYRSQMEKIKEEFDREDISNLTDILLTEQNTNPGTQICKYAENNDIDLIIMGSRGLGNVKKLFLGSASNNVVQHAKCPVLVIK